MYPSDFPPKVLSKITESKLTTAVQETKNTVNKQIEDCQNSLQTVQNDVKNRLKELFDVDIL